MEDRGNTGLTHNKWLAPKHDDDQTSNRTPAILRQNSDRKPSTVSTLITRSIRSCLKPTVTTPPPLGVNAMQPIPNRCPPASSLTTVPVARLHTVADGCSPRSPTASMPPSLENARQLTALLARKYLLLSTRWEDNGVGVKQGDRG